MKDFQNGNLLRTYTLLSKKLDVEIVLCHNYYEHDK